MKIRVHSCSFVVPLQKRRFRSGFVLILVITAMAIVGIEMFVLAGVSNTMQFQSHTAYLQACRRNLTASGLAWAKQNPARDGWRHIPNKVRLGTAGAAGESAPQTIKLETSEMDIRGSELDLTISSGSPRVDGSGQEAEVLVKTSCSRGRQTLRGENQYKLSL